MPQSRVRRDGPGRGGRPHLAAPGSKTMAPTRPSSRSSAVYGPLRGVARQLHAAPARGLAVVRIDRAAVDPHGRAGVVAPRR
jgi:hypothetical protein